MREETTNSLAGKYLTFLVSKERYGLEILKVQEIIQMTQITLVPKCPNYIKGVINLRGRIIPVFDLRTKFNIAAKTDAQTTCIIIANLQVGDNKITIGMVVDSVLDVINFSSEEIEQPPNYGQQLEGKFILGMGKRDEHLNILLNLEKLINPHELLHNSA